MNDKTRQQISELLANPEKLLATKPYYRKTSTGSGTPIGREIESIGATVRASLPKIRRRIIPLTKLLEEYDPWSHSVLTDENVPSITVKSKDNGWVHIESKRMPIPVQQNITKKQTLHLCNNPMTHVLLNTDPTEKQSKHFIRIKQMWDKRNMDGVKTEAVLTQKSESVVGMLFYHDYKGRIKARILRYSDGYVIITHKNDNGDHVLECVYYISNGVEYIDCYDDQYMYRLTSSAENIVDESAVVSENGWVYHQPVVHGFDECPLAVKRGPVAWDNVQDLIELYERTYNTFMVIQNRYGWGALYIKGKLNPKGKKINGSIVLNDSSMAPEADAKYLTPPSPQNMIETLDTLEYSIQKGSGTTSILPKDIKMSGDISGVAVQLTQELDIETALQDVNDWQNFANKMMRLFKEGLARELVNSGDKEYDLAITDFRTLEIQSKFVVWRPQSNEAYNQMLAMLSGAGAISRQTLIEKNTESCPDEVARIQKEKESDIQLAALQQDLDSTQSDEQNETNTDAE